MSRPPVDGLWSDVVSWHALEAAAERATRGKWKRRDVAAFWFEREREIARLHDELASGTYRPGAFRSHRITRPKPRLISAAPFRDRVVHHAVMGVLEPILERRFHPDSYACRPGKGTHAAAERVQVWMRRRRFLLTGDVRQFFPSIDHGILKALFRTRVADTRLLELMDRIVDASNEQDPVTDWFPGDGLWTPVSRRRGLPIGNLTSQWFANWMLDDLDHFVTSTLGLGAYVRYCDDFVVLANDAGRLREAAEAIRAFLAARRLRLHEGKSQVRGVGRGVAFVGYRLGPYERRLKPEWLRRYRRRVRWMQREFAAGRVECEQVRRRLAGVRGHAAFAGDGAVRSLAVDWRFSRASAVAPRAAGRQLEQQSQELPLGEPQPQHARQPEQQHRVPSRPAPPSAGAIAHPAPDPESPRFKDPASVIERGPGGCPAGPRAGESEGPGS